MPQHIEQSWRQHHIAILAALTLIDTDHHLGAVDVADLERYDFRGSQAAAVGETQQQAVFEARGGSEQVPHFLWTEHQWNLLRLGDVLDLIGDVGSSQRYPEQKGYPRHRTIAGADAHALLGEMQLKQPDILGSRRVGRTAQEHCQPLAAADVCFLGARGEVAQAHVFDHALTQLGDGHGAHRNSYLERVANPVILKTVAP